MSTKKFLIAFSVMLFMVSLSCTFDSSDEDQLYENAIDKDEIDPDKDSQAIDKDEIDPDKDSSD